MSEGSRVLEYYVAYIVGPAVAVEAMLGEGGKDPPLYTQTDARRCRRFFRFRPDIESIAKEPAMHVDRAGGCSPGSAVSMRRDSQTDLVLGFH